MKAFYGDFPIENSRYENSEIVLIPVPYDGTSTWIKGADKGPQAIIEASDSIEMWDIETQSEVYLKGIHTDSAVLEKSSPEAMFEAVYQRVAQRLSDEKWVGILGGEHSVSCGSIKAHAEKFADLTVLQIDAHADLREEYHGSKFNHACVMRRAQEWCRVVQVGIRSVCKEEMEFIDPNSIFYAHQLWQNNDWIDKVIEKLSSNVYLTIDLDGLDPSILPSTGTPEPGGLSWWQLLTLIERLTKAKRLVGFDVVELCPNPAEKSSDLLAAKLVYKILSMKYAFQKQI
ncbi:MAG: agmatinase [Bacteroidales bacterium]|nr:agmatinase [Bacteroidales bacterium]MDD4574868.1 agmatinase [Bacteroidales bacterium]